jgi:hypothetical protein
MAASLFAWVAVTQASDPTAVQQGPSRGATPEPPTPTLQDAAESTLAGTIDRIRKGGGGAVADEAFAGDVKALADRIVWDSRRCDGPEIKPPRCDAAGVPVGTLVQAIRLDDIEANRLYDRTYIEAMLKAVVGSEDVTLVFAAAIGDRIALGFALAAPVARPVGEGNTLQGVWLEVQTQPGPQPKITRVYPFGPLWGPRQVVQTYYKDENAQIWYFDKEHSPAAAAVPTPAAPPPRSP